GAVEVADRLPPQAEALAEQIRAGAGAAFLPPLQTACLVLGSILMAGAVFLGWFAPRRVIDDADSVVG
ncbi:MAG: MFS transporter, partial [Gordonia sp. (in: high G+C Gram-positive bacteria)]